MCWSYHPVRDAQIREKVWTRIHNRCLSKHAAHPGKRSFAAWCSLWIANPAYSAFTLTLIIAMTLASMCVVKQNLRASQTPNPLLTYRQMVSPATFFKEDIGDRSGFRRIADRDPITHHTLIKTIAWVEKAVALESQQRRPFQQVHEQYYEDYGSLRERLVALENQYRRFERQRIAGEEINLLDVYANMNAQRLIYQQAIRTQQEFIDELLLILNPEQKSRYKQLMAPALTPTTKPNSTNNKPI